MKKISLKLSIILLIINIFSCNSNDIVFVVDEMFNEFWLPQNKLQIEVVNSEFIEFDKFLKYTTIVLSPYLFKMNKDKILNLKNNFLVMDLDVETEHVKPIQLSNIVAYTEFINKFGDAYAEKKISVFFDKNFNTEIENLLQRLDADFRFFYLDNDTTKSELNNIINELGATDLWIIDTNLFGYSVYNLISDGDIMIVGGSKLAKFNKNIKFSIELKAGKNLLKVVKENKRIIQRELIKY